MTSLLLVRHAHARWSLDEMRSLSSKGEFDAHRLADQLSVLPITAVYSSPYRRSLGTVSPLATRLDLSVQELPDLRERALGSFSPSSFENAVFSTWTDFEFAYPGGESNREAQRRGISAIRFLATRHPKELVVVGTHGNLLALILNVFDDRITFGFWRALEFPDVLRLDLEPSGEGTYHRLKARAV